MCLSHHHEKETPPVFATLWDDTDLHLCFDCIWLNSKMFSNLWWIKPDTIKRSMSFATDINVIYPECSNMQSSEETEEQTIVCSILKQNNPNWIYAFRPLGAEFPKPYISVKVDCITVEWYFSAVPYYVECHRLQVQLGVPSIPPALLPFHTPDFPGSSSKSWKILHSMSVEETAEGNNRVFH